MNQYCTQCGADLIEGARFCKKCGAQVTPTQPTVDYQAQNRTSEYAAPSYQWQAPGQDYNQYPYQTPYQPPLAPMAQAGLKPNVAGMLCYPLLVITGIIFLVLAPFNRDRFVKFHAYQAIFFGVGLFLARIAINIASIVLPWFLENLLFRGLNLITLVGIIYAMYKAYHNEQAKLPLVGDLAEQQAAK